MRLGGFRSRLDAGFRSATVRLAVAASVPFFFVACVFTYYGQLNRDQTNDAYGTIYTSVAIVKQHTIWLDSYYPILQQHAGIAPSMVTVGPGGHKVNSTPSAGSLLALPVVAAFSAAGAKATDWNAWMEASMLTAALVAAASVAVLFVALTRLTTRRRAALIAATYAWGTLEWGISGQALWEHTGATLALSVALLAFVDRRLALAGFSVAAMVAFRPSAPVIALFLLPLVGRSRRAWGRFLLGILPFVLPVLIYNTVAFGSPLHQGYGSSHLREALSPDLRLIVQGVPGLLFAPGRGLFVYSPVLLFAVAGFFLRRRDPLYRWSGIACAVYTISAGNVAFWYGGECFGARRLTDMLPLLAILLVPALDAIAGTRWMPLYLALLAWSVFVEVLNAAAAYPSRWFDTHLDLANPDVWWRLTDNEIVTKLQSPGLALRLVEMLVVAALGVAGGLLANRAAAGFRGARRV